MEDDVKYKLRASSLDDPVSLHEALLRWYKYGESSNYNSMGCVIEELLMTRKVLLRKPALQACESSSKHTNTSKTGNVPSKYPSSKYLTEEKLQSPVDISPVDNFIEQSQNVVHDDEFYNNAVQGC